jgi:hypothetical protein
MIFMISLSFSRFRDLSLSLSPSCQAAVARALVSGNTGRARVELGGVLNLYGT